MHHAAFCHHYIALKDLLRAQKTVVNTPPVYKLLNDLFNPNHRKTLTLPHIIIIVVLNTLGKLVSYIVVIYVSI